MRRKERIFAALLLIVMAFNIGRYQVPYLEYYLFKDYIAKNLCVKKDVKNNCCQGKCFLEKQKKLADDSTNATTSNSENSKKISSDQLIDCVLLDSEASIKSITKTHYTISNVRIITHFFSDVFVPPQSIA